MSTKDLLSSTTNWPGRGLYGLKSSVTQTTECSLVKQEMVKDHMKNHYRKLSNVRSAIDSKPPKSMILGQKCRDRARKEMAQISYTKNVLDGFALETMQSSRGTSRPSSQNRFVQSQPVTSRARSRSAGSARQLRRASTINGSVGNIRGSNSDLVGKFFKNGTISQALTTMTAIGKITSSERNRATGDVLEKHPDSFVQPNPNEHKPRLVKSDAKSALKENRVHYNPPRRVKRVESAESPKENGQSEIVKKTPQDELREQLNRSLEIRNDVENKLKKAKRKSTIKTKDQSQATIDKFSLTEENRVEYVRFMKRLTDEIIRKDLSTEPAIEKLFQLHLSRYGSNLDQGHLYELLEAFKQDRGVSSTRDRKNYRTIEQATKFDQYQTPLQLNDPNKIEPLILTERNQANSSRRSSYDLNEPFSWQDEKIEQKPKPIVPPRAILNQIQHQTLFHGRESISDDDDVHQPVKDVKPRISVQMKRRENVSDDDDGHQPVTDIKPRTSVQMKRRENVSDDDDGHQPVKDVKPRPSAQMERRESISDDDDVHQPVKDVKPRPSAQMERRESISDDDDVHRPVTDIKPRTSAQMERRESISDDDDVHQPVKDVKPRPSVQMKRHENVSDDDDVHQPAGNLKSQTPFQRQSKESISDDNEISQPSFSPKRRTSIQAKSDKHTSDDDQEENMKLHDTDWFNDDGKENKSRKTNTSMKQNHDDENEKRDLFSADFGNTSMANS